MGAGCTRCVTATSPLDESQVQGLEALGEHNIANSKNSGIHDERGIRFAVAPVLDEIIKDAQKNRRGREVELEIASRSRTSSFSRASTRSPPRKSNSDGTQKDDATGRSSSSHRSNSSHSSADCAARRALGSSEEDRPQLCIAFATRTRVMQLKPLKDKQVGKPPRVAEGRPVATRAASSDSTDAILDQAIIESRSKSLDKVSDHTNELDLSASDFLAAAPAKVAMVATFGSKMSSALWQRRYGKLAQGGTEMMPPPPSFLKVSHAPKDTAGS